MKGLHRIKCCYRSLSTSCRLSALCWPRPNYGPIKLQKTQKINGTKIAGAKPLGAQMGACTVMFQAGSRYEIGDQLGSTHFLRLGAGGSGKYYPEYMKTRMLQHHGAYLTCSSDRETISYTLRCPPPMFPDLRHFLVDATKNNHYHWEIDDRRQLVRDDIQRISPEQRVMDLIQKASFSGSLSNSVFCEEDITDSLDEKSIGAFKSNNFKSNGCSVASVGFDFEDSVRIADEIELRYDEFLSRKETPSKHKSGYEFYDLGPNSTTYIAVAVPGCSSKDLCSLLKYAVVAAACGTGYSQGGQHSLDSTIQQPLGSLNGGDVYTTFRAFNISYGDCGIFGILARTRAETAKDVAFHAVNFLRNVGGLSHEQITVGQRRLKLNLTIHEQDCVKYTEGLALQMLNSVEINSICDAMSMIDQIFPDDVRAVAESITKSSEMSYAVVGDIGRSADDGDLMYS